MSRTLTIRWEERDQVWQAPAGEFYVEIIQDPGESSRERLGALNALIRLDKQIHLERRLKGQQDPSEEAAALIKNALIRLRESQAARNAAKAAEN